MTAAATDAKKARIGSCPHCGQSTRLDEANRWRPFCSERCRLLDLGDWFGERYRIPSETPPDPQDNPDHRAL